MLDKFTQVYAKLIAESVANKKKSALSGLKKNCKPGKKGCKGAKKIIKEGIDDTKVLNVTFVTDDEGVRCFAGACEGVGSTVEEALQDFASKFDSASCNDCFECGDEAGCDEDINECGDEAGCEEDTDECNEDIDEDDEGEDDGEAAPEEGEEAPELKKRRSFKRK